MKVSKFIIPLRLPTLNEVINISRGNTYKASEQKKHYTQLCGIYAKKIKPKLDPKGLYSLALKWTVADNRMDPDNVYFGVKFILDGVVSLGALNGDGRKNIKNISHTIETGDDYSVEVKFIKE